MNKYLACFSFVALCFCMIEAATRNEVQRVIHQANEEVRSKTLVAISTTSRDAMLRATTPQQKSCIASKKGLANRDVNTGLRSGLLTVEGKYSNLTPQQLEQIDLNSLYQEVYQIFANAASSSQGWIDEINRCA